MNSAERSSSVRCCFFYIPVCERTHYEDCMNNDIQIFKNEVFGEVRVAGTSEKPLFIYKDKEGECAFNVYELLAIAYDSENDEFSKKLILLLDCLSIENKYYWSLRDAVMTANTALNLQKERSYKKSKCQTYLMKDENTGFTKIGKSIHPKKRERTLQSEKPTISLFKVCDKLVEKELHDYFSIKHVRGEWYHLSDEDIKYILSKYNFK